MALLSLLLMVTHLAPRLLFASELGSHCAPDVKGAEVATFAAFTFRYLHRGFVCWPCCVFCYCCRSSLLLLVVIDDVVAVDVVVVVAAVLAAVAAASLEPCWCTQAPNASYSWNTPSHASSQRNCRRHCCIAWSVSFKIYLWASMNTSRADGEDLPSPFTPAL